MAKDGFKVVIVGGGVGGLTLANMLEKFDIDYVILESHAEVAPQVGASIGMFPNGLRILDQIGCYQPIADLPCSPLRLNRLRDTDGTPLTLIPEGYDHMMKRHGYPVLFFDRQWLLQILYDKIQHKDRVLLNKKVTQIDHIDGGIKAQTEDGSSYKGSILVGVDGIWSTVREKMFELGNELRPGHFPVDEPDKVPCYYKCSFGIAKNVPNYTEGEFNVIKGRGLSQLIISGPEGRVYWFIFVRLPEPKFGDDIPRYNKEDEAMFAKEYAALPITKKVNFGQLFSKRISSALTPLHEVVFEKWWFQRILIFGDAAHKPDPIGGQGGNGAIESAAELLNALLEAKGARPAGLNDLSVPEVEAIFEKMQASRHERANDIVSLSHDHQSINSSVHPWLTDVIWNLVSPIIGPEFYLRLHAYPLLGTSKLKALPVVKRPHVIPYNDELPAKPSESDHRTMGLASLVLVMGFLIYVTFKAWRLDLPAFQTWAGFAAIDRPWASPEVFGGQLLRTLASIFSYGLEGSLATKLHLTYFLSQLVSPIMVLTIEGHRTGNYGTPLAIPTLYLALMQVFGIGRIAPLYAVLFAFIGDTFPTGRYVNPATARVVPIALTLGYVIPTAFLLLPSVDKAFIQDATAVWQVAPIATCALVTILSVISRLWTRLTKSSEKSSSFNHYEKDDIPALNASYTYAFMVQAAAHILVLSFAYIQSDFSFFDTFFDLPHIFTEDWSLPDLAAQVAVFFRYDMAIGLGSIVLSNLFSVWQLRTSGYIGNCDAIKGAVAVIIGQALVGPGATWAGLWAWREGVLASLNQFS
ncbi:unnamed protein product [Clonostachys rosea]|uniref:FAD-binding domain-containing protein n=1 Tax=Bionectria ochroleuca TaxID=29856 RepID=A0ABY6U1P4_BIOOC|nr:unnamed protein product [Clonostachys rosea]